MKIVIVDGSNAYRSWLQEQIEALGGDYLVEGAFPNAHLALDYLSAHETDVLITEVTAGLDLLKGMKQKRSRVYTVILTDREDFDPVREALRLGVQEYVLKLEVDRDQLEIILENAARFVEARDKVGLQHEKDLERSWDECMRRFLRMEFPDSRKAEIYLRNQKVFLWEKNLAAVGILFDEPVSREKVTELVHLFFEGKNTGCFCFQSAPGEFFALIRATDGEKLNLWGRELCSLLKCCMGGDVFVGLSPRADGFHRIPLLCSQAWMAAANRKFFGTSCSRTFASMREPALTESGEQIVEIGNLLRSRDFNRASLKGLAFFGYLREAGDFHPWYVIALGKEVLSLFLRELLEMAPEEEKNRRILDILLSLGREYSSYSLFQEDMEEGISYICNVLARRFGWEKYSLPVQGMIRYVELHYQERISLEDAAFQAGVSRSHASVLFKRETGMLFSDYLLEVRLRHACEILRWGDESVREAGEMAGFPDAGHFSRVFKDRMGMSPSEYRQSLHSPESDSF